MLLKDCAKDCVYFNKEIDSISQSIKKTNKEAVSQSGGETYESKSDNDFDSNDSEEEMLDDSDDEYSGYSGCGRGYYYCDGRYERKVSPMMSPIISSVSA